MPRVSRNGEHFVSGRAGWIEVDGLVPPELAGLKCGVWDFTQDDYEISGPGGFDNSHPEGNGIFSFNLRTRVLTKVPVSIDGQYEPHPEATEFFGDAPRGRWLARLAQAGHLRSYDSEGRLYPGLSALGIGPDGDYLLTDENNRSLEIWSNGQKVQERPVRGDWEPIDGGWFSPFAYALTPYGMFACGYREQPGGLCIWNPFDQNTFVWWISATDDFYPCMAWRRIDSTLVIASAKTQGDTGLQVYEIELGEGLVRKVGYPWRKLTDAPPQPPLDIVPVNRKLYAGWFVGADRSGLPGNCFLQAWQGGNDYVTTADGRIIAKYIAATPDEGNLAELDRLCMLWDAEHPEIPSLGYWTRGAQQLGLCKARYPLVEGYVGADESIYEADLRIRQAMARSPNCWLLAQCYDSNKTLTSHLRELVPMYARIVRDMGKGLLVFSGTDAARGRATGYFDHPEVQELWKTLMGSVTGLPDVIVPAPKPAEKYPTAIPYEVVHA